MTEIAREVLAGPAVVAPSATTVREQEKELRRRLAPLTRAAFVAGLILWLPIEKLFMSGIGFDAALIGILVAAYAVLVPALEVVTGVVADRWSRRGVLVIGYLGLAASSLVGGLSHDVASYFVSALLFSGYVACSTGTTDAMVYDTVLEVTGSGRGYQAQAGRLKLASSAGLLVGALGGGALAGVTSPRTTYLLTAPLLVVAMLIVLRFREPVLYRAVKRDRFRDQLGAVWATIGRQRRLRPVVAFLVVNGALMAVFWDFHQLWLVEQSAALSIYGPFMAALFLTEGIGGWLAGRIGTHHGAALSIAAALLFGGTLLLVADAPTWLVVVAIAAMLGASSLAGIVMSNLLHGQVPSGVRAGVVSGVSSLTWILFTPAAVGFGGLAGRHGLPVASWLVVCLAVGVAVAVAWVLAGRRSAAMRR